MNGTRAPPPLEPVKLLSACAVTGNPEKMVIAGAKVQPPNRALLKELLSDAIEGLQTA